MCATAVCVTAVCVAAGARLGSSRGLRLAVCGCCVLRLAVTCGAGSGRRHRCCHRCCRRCRRCCRRCHRCRRCCCGCRCRFADRLELAALGLGLGSLTRSSGLHLWRMLDILALVLALGGRHRADLFPSIHLRTSAYRARTSDERAPCRLPILLERRRSRAWREGTRAASRQPSAMAELSTAAKSTIDKAGCSVGARSNHLEGPQSDEGASAGATS